MQQKTLAAISPNPRKGGWGKSEKVRIWTVSERYGQAGERRREAAFVNETDNKWRPGHSGALE